MKFKGYILFLIAIVGLIGCSKDPDPVDPMTTTIEQITTFRLLMLPDMNKPFQISYRDIDDTGPAEPIIMTGEATANTGYTCNLTLFDETVIPELDITNLIQQEGVNYQIFYVGNGIDIDVDVTDEDVNGNPLGFAARITTGDAAEGSITIIVRNNPTKNSSNNPDAAGGTTIAEVTIPFTIE